MENIFTAESLLSLIPLTLMEILLGIDNVIFVSIILSRLDKNQTKKAGFIWMTVGIIMRILFLFILGYLIKGEQVIWKNEGLRGFFEGVLVTVRLIR